MEPIRWGVIGCGWIANKFAAGLAAQPAGKTESKIHPPAKTLAIMAVMDTLRSQWNLTYPDE